MNGNQRDAGSYVLEGQIKPRVAQNTDVPNLSVQLHDPITNIHLREALVRRHRVDLGKEALVSVALVVGVGLEVVEVERLFAGADDAGQAVTVTKGEFDLNVDALGRATPDPVSPEPVVLIGLHHVTHLVCSDGDVLLVHDAHLFPLHETVRNDENQDLPNIKLKSF